MPILSRHDRCTQSRRLGEKEAGLPLRRHRNELRFLQARSEQRALSSNDGDSERKRWIASNITTILSVHPQRDLLPHDPAIRRNGARRMQVGATTQESRPTLWHDARCLGGRFYSYRDAGVLVRAFSLGSLEVDGLVPSPAGGWDPVYLNTVTGLDKGRGLADSLECPR